MKLEIYDSHEKQSQACVDLIIQVIAKNPSAVLCFATGDSPKRTYELFVERIKNENINLSQCSFIGLDEWVGIKPSNPGSCHWFLHHYLLIPLNIKMSQVHLFNGMSGDLHSECTKMNAFIEKKGIDLMLVGIGMNGHIGFNEPGSDEESNAHIVELAQTTLSVGKKYFNGSMETTTGITLGLKHFLDAKATIMLANGKSKSGIIKNTIQHSIGTNIPSTLIRKHPNAVLMLDKDAGWEILEKQNQ